MKLNYVETNVELLKKLYNKTFQNFDFEYSRNSNVEEAYFYYIVSLYFCYEG